MNNFMPDECMRIRDAIFDLEMSPYYHLFAEDTYFKFNNNFLAMDDVESFVMRLI